MNSKNIKSVLKTQAKVIAYVIICLVVIVIGISYSLYSEVEHNSQNQVVKAGNLTFTYTNGNQITDAKEACFNQVSYEDAQKLTDCAYIVTVKNTGTLPGKYSLTLQKTQNAGNDHVDLSKLKVILKKAGQVVQGYPKTVSTLSNGLLIENEIIQKGSSVEYSIQVFADEGTILETDNGKNISLEVIGTGEVNPTSINP